MDLVWLVMPLCLVAKLAAAGAVYLYRVSQ
jgi:hypothetical protein